MEDISVLSYDGVKQNLEQFLACTSLTVEEFDILLPSFSQAWSDYVKKITSTLVVANQS